MKPYYEDDNCTIYHGDAFEVLHDLDGVGAIITDPPYSSGGAFRSDRTRNTTDKYVNSDTAAYRPDFAGDNRDQHGFAAWCALWLSAGHRACVEGAVVACFTDWRQLPTMTDAIQAGGFVWRGVAVWAKGFGRPRNGGFSSSAEFVAWGSAGPLQESDQYPPGLFESPTPSEKLHVAQKPEPVMRWLCGVAPPGTVVLDPFMGSGTTLRAAKDLGHRAIGIDVDERYCEIAADRLAQEVLPL